MQIQELYNALRSCTLPNAAEVKQIEELIKLNERNVGHSSNLLKIVLEPSAELEVRLVAALRLNRLVERTWSPIKENDVSLPKEDKVQIRKGLLNALVQCPDTIRSHLTKILETLIDSDYPAHWPELNAAVTQGLYSQADNVILVSLLILRRIALNYQFKTKKEDQEICKTLIHISIPRVLVIFNTCALSSDLADIHGEIIKAICKLVWSILFFTVPPILQQPSNFNLLMKSLLLLVQKELPYHKMPVKESEKCSWIWWKAKEWVLCLTNKFIGNYGTTEDVDNNEIPTANLYIVGYSLPMLKAHMQFLATLSKMINPPDAILLQLMNYMTTAVSIDQTYEAMKNDIKLTLINILFPLLCFSDSEAELLDKNPENYINKSDDMLEDRFEVKKAASQFCQGVCQKNSQYFTNDLFPFLHDIIIKYNKLLSEGQEPSDLAREMDGALLVLTDIEPMLNSQEICGKKIENLLVQYIIPCFQSKYSHLRSQACKMAGKYSRIASKEVTDKVQTFQLLLQSILVAMKDPELVVCVDATIALMHFIVNMENLGNIKVILKDLLDNCCRLMNEICNDDLVSTLETIIEEFGKDITPFAHDLAKHLKTIFIKHMEVKDKQDKDVDYASACIGTMTTLFENVLLSPTMYAFLESIFFDVIDFILNSENKELVGDLIDMMNALLSHSSRISNVLWSLFPKFSTACMTWAFQYFDDMRSVLETYLTKGKDTFSDLKTPEYFYTFNKVLEYALDGDFDECYYHPALKLMAMALQSWKGHAHRVVPSYIHLILNKMKTAQQGNTKVLLINVLASAMWCDAPLALQALSQKGALKISLSLWFELIFAKKPNKRMKYFHKIYDKTIGVLGLCSLVTVPGDQFPAELIPAQVFRGIIILLDATKIQEENIIDAIADEDDDHCDTDGSSDDEDLHTLAIDPYTAFLDTLSSMETSNVNRLQKVLAEMDQTSRDALYSMMKYVIQKKTGSANQPLKQ